MFGKMIVLISQMMKKIVVSFAIFTLLSSTIFAQIIVKSPEYNTFQGIYAGFNIKEIIDARPDTSAVVGIVMDTTKGITFEKVVFEKGVVDMFHSLWINTVMTKENTIPSVLKINYLEFNKRKHKDENVYWVYADFELFEIKFKDTYIPLKRIQKLIEVSSADPDDSKNYTKLTWEFWSDFVFDNFSARFDKEYRYVYRNELITPKMLPAVMKADSLVSGAYLTFDEFLNNAPSRKKIKFDGKKLFILGKNLDYREISTQRPIWGVSFNGIAYVAIKDDVNPYYEYFPIEPLGTAFEIAGIVLKPYLPQLLTEEKRKEWLDQVQERSTNMDAAFKRKLAEGISMNLLFSRGRYTYEMLLSSPYLKEVFVPLIGGQLLFKVVRAILKFSHKDRYFIDTQKGYLKGITIKKLK